MTEWSGPLKVCPARVDDAKEIIRIHNQGVHDRAATFENAYVTPEERFLWLAARPENHPALVAEVKHTLIVRNIPKTASRSSPSILSAVCAAMGWQELMKAMQDASREKSFHKIIGRIMAVNDGARRLCQVAGWHGMGLREKHGKLDGEWHDLWTF
jgi:L-amino acid N-acyltransferase YncA